MLHGHHGGQAGVQRETCFVPLSDLSSWRASPLPAMMPLRHWWMNAPEKEEARKREGGATAKSDHGKTQATDNRLPNTPARLAAAIVVPCLLRAVPAAGCRSFAEKIDGFPLSQLIEFS